MKKWEYIILHHSLTKDSESVSWRAIRKYHTQTLGWFDIGYHFGIENVNGTYEAFAGRPLDKDGAHTRGMNKKAIGVCFIGNFDLTSPPDEQIKCGIKLIRGLCWAFDIPIINIKAHSDYASKTCPGELFQMDNFRDFLMKIKLKCN